MKDEIVIYQTDKKSIRLEVRIEDETVWLTQTQMAKLFQNTSQNINIHIRKIYQEGELSQKGNVRIIYKFKQKESVRLNVN